MSARRLAAALFMLLLPWQVAWQLWLAPPVQVPPWFALGFWLAPLLPGAVLILGGHRLALAWAGLLSLPAFCHAIMELWTSPAARLAAAIQLLIVLAFHGLLVWLWWRGRQAKRNPAGPLSA